MLPNVKKVTIEPFIKKHVAQQSQVYTDEYNIYDDLESWGFRHKTVCHGKGEYARDDDKDGITRFTLIRWRDFGHCYARG